MVATALALVRPVGMSDVAAEEWAALAATELRDVPADLLDDAMAQARRTATHHGQIVPTVFTIVQDRWEQRKRIRFGLIEQAGGVAPRRGDWWQPSADELDAVKRDLAEKMNRGGDGL